MRRIWICTASDLLPVGARSPPSSPRPPPLDLPPPADVSTAQFLWLLHVLFKFTCSDHLHLSTQRKSTINQLHNRV